MTENLKKFLVIISGESKEYQDKMSKANMEEIIAAAAEKGIELTAADLTKEESRELNVEELDKVAGGMVCVLIGAGDKCGCFSGGYGNTGWCAGLGWDS